MAAPVRRLGALARHLQALGQPQGGDAAAATALVGGCVQPEPVAEPPADLRAETPVVPTSDFPPFETTTLACGMTLIGMGVPDEFLAAVAGGVRACFGSGDLIDEALQDEVMRNMAIFGATCPSWQGIDMPEMLRRDDGVWAETRKKVSVCDHISQVEAGEGPQGQTMVRMAPCG